MSEKVTKTDAEWRAQLDPIQFEVARKKATERPFTGKYWDTKTPGTYVCVCCGQELFKSEAKFDSGCGWPSFYAEAKEGNVETEVDGTLGMTRTEILCSKCDAHLGHVFDDGPQPTGLRYCVNSASVDLKART